MVGGEYAELWLLRGAATAARAAGRTDAARVYAARTAGGRVRRIRLLHRLTGRLNFIGRRRFRGRWFGVLRQVVVGVQLQAGAERFEFSIHSG